MPMNRPVVLALAAVLAASGCGPSIPLRVLKPAAVSIPAEVQTVAVVDRSRAANVGQSVLGVLEGALSGESIAADNEGRLESINSLVGVLAESPRFEVITPTVTPKEVDSNLFDKPWDHRSVVKLCKQHGCDGIIALEAFDSDSSIDSGLFRQDDSKYDETNSTHWATRRTRVVTSWRFYDVSADRHLDQMRDHDEVDTWEKQALSVQDAINELPNQRDTIRQVGRRNGNAYGHRIAPAYITVTRSYYGGGSDEMKQARDHVRATDWDGAVPIWKDIIANTTDAKLRGKARFNLAVAAEVNGQLKKAHSIAKKAAVDLANGKSRNYAAALSARIRDQERLEQQLTPPVQQPKPTPTSKPAPNSNTERAADKPTGRPTGGSTSGGSTDGGGIQR